jgi:hypothetical protein
MQFVKPPFNYTLYEYFLLMKFRCSDNFDNLNIYGLILFTFIDLFNDKDKFVSIFSYTMRVDFSVYFTKFENFSGVFLRFTTIILLFQFSHIHDNTYSLL